MRKGRRTSSNKKNSLEAHHREFADKIIAAIKDGTAPWQKPWAPGEQMLPENVDTGKPYQGGNLIHLVMIRLENGYSDRRWGTYRQIKKRDGQVRKGERGTRIISYRDSKRVAVRDERGRHRKDSDGKKLYRYEKLKIPHMSSHTVFNADQALGLPEPEIKAPEPLWEMHTRVEELLDASGVTLRHVEDDRAFYNIKKDMIILPEKGQFPSATHYYQTALHELAHASGHPDRMDRDMLKEGIKKGFGSKLYAREELRAEIASMMIGDRLGIGHNPSRGAAYVENWVKVLSEDPQEIRTAAADAQRIADYILFQQALESEKVA